MKFVYLTVSKTRPSTISNDFKNPFLGSDREKIWGQMDEKGKVITKEEVFERVEKIRNARKA